MNKSVVFTILANLVLGNLILYIHEIYGRNQKEFSMLWLSFSLIAIVMLPFAARILRTKKSILITILLSLAVSFLIPVIGFWISMLFTLNGLFMGFVYLLYGFPYFILPMWILNFFAFRWIQNSRL